MRKALNRKGRYGWSRGYAYTPGSKQFSSDAYLENYDGIKWRSVGYDKSWCQVRRPGEGCGRGVVVMRKVFN